MKGVQSKNVSACLKHFIANDTEFERHTVSSNVDERTLREVYLLPFEMGVIDGKSKSVMSAYNKLNNIYCSSHKELLVDILKNEWGFDGYVVSDWGAALETIENANGGLDLEMPGPGNTWGEKLLIAISEGLVKEEIINDKVKRILSIMEFTGRSLSPEKSNTYELYSNIKINDYINTSIRAFKSNIKNNIEYISNKYQNDRDNIDLNQSGLNLNIKHYKNEQFREDFSKKNMVVITELKKIKFENQIKVEEFPINIQTCVFLLQHHHVGSFCS